MIIYYPSSIALLWTPLNLRETQKYWTLSLWGGVVDWIKGKGLPSIISSAKHNMQLASNKTQCFRLLCAIIDICRRNLRRKKTEQNIMCRKNGRSVVYGLEVRQRHYSWPRRSWLHFGAALQFEVHPNTVFWSDLLVWQSPRSHSRLMIYCSTFLIQLLSCSPTITIWADFGLFC